MFTLRRVDKHGHGQTNIFLGGFYKLIHREWNPEEFRKEYFNHHVEPEAPDDSEQMGVYGIIQTKTGQYLLEQSQWNYIMTESGATFDNLSYKPVTTTADPA